MSKKAEHDRDWKNDPLENTPPVRGSGNFLKDRGYPDPAATRIKFALVSAIRQSAAAKKLRQIDIVTEILDLCVRIDLQAAAPWVVHKDKRSPIISVDVADANVLPVATKVGKSQRLLV